MNTDTSFPALPASQHRGSYGGSHDESRRAALGDRLLKDPAWHLMALMAVAIAAGGGGAGAGAGNLAVQLAALAVMALNPRAFSLFFRRKPDALTILVVLTLLVPLVQIIPLPPAIWTTLPGRDMVSGSLAATVGTDAGRTQAWFPFSLFPGRTLIAALGLIAPVTILVVGSVLPDERLRQLVAIVAGLAVAAMLFGSMHLLNPGTGYLHENANTHYGANVLLGTFADRNANALFYDAALLLLVGLPARHLSAAWIGALVAAGLLLVLGTVLTQSRTGLLLLVFPLGLLALKGLAALKGSGARRPGGTDGPDPGISRLLAVALIALAIMTMAVGVVGLSGQNRISSTFDRLANAGDGKREEMREDSLKAARHYWPAGAGMGTFSEVFQVDESLEYLSPRTAGRAHMDYYELAIECGIAGLALLAAWIIWVLRATWNAMRRADWMALAGSGIVACIAAQSVLSFPLRNQTVLAMAALAIVLLSRTAQRKTKQPA